MGGILTEGAAKAVSQAVERHCGTCRFKTSLAKCGGCWRTSGHQNWRPLEGHHERVTPRPEAELSTQGGGNSPAYGLRYNKGKRRFDLIPPDSLALLADLLTVGAEKYAERNWEIGMPYKDAMGSLERHYQAWKSGEDRDPESGMSHMVHVFCNAMFLATWELRGVGTDDRVKVKMPDVPTRPR